ncbi:MAG: YigZ family protein, partial [Sphingomonadales bacterium]|nr:YigZ family protein [Sphingomonadales bacterium]
KIDGDRQRHQRPRAALRQRLRARPPTPCAGTLPKFARATHNSWGLIGPEGPVKSDDGEAGAGAIILKMLEGAALPGHLIVVTRWYGGKHLGGDRFRHVAEAVRLYLAEIGAA